MHYAPLLALLACAPLTVHRWRRLLCIRGHRHWDTTRNRCLTCRRTAEAIRRGN